MRTGLRCRALGALSLLLGALAGCSSDSPPEMDGPWRRPAAPANAGSTGDVCAPGNATSALQNPLATCALSHEYRVKNLLRPAAKSGGGPAPTSAFNVGLQALAGPAIASCNGKHGPGYDTCGAAGNDSCCRTAALPDGHAAGFQADAFELGVYEVTSARFEAFVAANGGDLRGAAAAAHWEGWDPAWNQHLPASRAEVDNDLGPACQWRSDLDDFGALTWPADRVTQSVARYMNDATPRAADIRADATAPRLSAKPVNCVTYYAAAAFCAWDGGRLPTNEEWAFAAYGGEELREFPWGAGRTAERLVTDLKRDSNSFTYPEDFPFYDRGMNAYHIAPPGSKPAGRARWGHEDMAGNVLEWVADRPNEHYGFVRGGSWEGHIDTNAFVYHTYPFLRSYGSLGIRCAYGAPPPAQPVDKGKDGPAPGVVPVYRGYAGAEGDHVQGLVANEGAPGYAPEGIAFRVLAAAPAAGGAPLNRCLWQRHHFLSNDPGCEGQAPEGQLGFVYVAPHAAPLTLPLYRCLRGADHLSTVTPGECERAGMVVEGTQGHVVPPPPSPFVQSVYEKGLGRAPEEGGHRGWLDLILSRGCGSASLADFIVGVYTSPEFLARNLPRQEAVAAVYRGALGREPDAEGAAQWTDKLASGALSWEGFVSSVALSAEATALAPARCGAADPNANPAGAPAAPGGGPPIIAGQCTHDVCVAGEKLGQQCDDCTMKVCAADKYCCDTFWGLSCFDAVEKQCGRHCGN